MSHALFPGWRPAERERPTVQSWIDAARQRKPDDAPLPQWRRADQWHVTLCFIGYGIGTDETQRAREALSRVGGAIPPHAIQIEGLVHWNGRRSMPVVALPAPSPELQALCDACRDALRSAGVKPVQATGTPHITLGYYPGGTPVQDWMQAVHGDDGKLDVDRFDLLFNPGGRYETLASWPLTGNALPRPPEQASLL